MIIVIIALGLSVVFLAWTNKNLTSERDFYKAKTVESIKKMKGWSYGKEILIHNQLSREYQQQGRK